MLYEDVYFCIHLIIFRHLELEIALAIPASNEWKIVLIKGFCQVEKISKIREKPTLTNFFNFF